MLINKLMFCFSQMFGESVGVWILNEWMKMGQPSKFQLVELGPGSGTLMTDVLRTFSRLSGQSMTDLTVQLVEISPRMRKLQQQALGVAENIDVDSGDGGVHDCKFGCKVSWHQHVYDVPRQFSFFIGNIVISSKTI